MKKFFSFFLAMALLCSCASSLADGYDVSYVKDHSNVFTIDVDEDSGIAFVESTLSTKDCSFVHKYESDYRYSSTMFDVLVVNYEKSTAYPVPRLWITTARMNTSITIPSPSPWTARTLPSPGSPIPIGVPKTRRASSKKP